MSEHPTPAERRTIARRVRSAAWQARQAALTAAPEFDRPLLPIPHDPDHSTRAALHFRTVRRGIAAPAPWPRWGLAEAYLTAEIYQTPRTLERCASLAVQAAARLGGITIVE